MPRERPQRQDLRGLVAVQEPGSTVAARAGQLVVLRDGAETRRISPARIAELHLYGDVELTALARQLLMREGVDVLLLGASGYYLGRMVGHDSSNGERRLAQLRYLADPADALSLAHRVVGAKLDAQRAFAQRLARKAPDPAALQAFTAGLGALRKALGGAATIAETMGFEGRASVLYYRALGLGLRHPTIRFERRTRRPPRDPANACLSYGYTLLCTRVESALRKAGLDVHLGALHQPGRSKPALALDVMEPWRVLVDRLTWRLLNRGQLVADDFESVERWDEAVSESPWVAGGVEVRPEDAHVDLGPATFLAASGRAVFLKEWAELWRDARIYAPHTGQRLTLQAILEAEVHALTRELEGGRDGAREPWEPWTLR
jgi:CRISPR-associated protein Cas1